MKLYFNFLLYLSYIISNKECLSVKLNSKYLSKEPVNIEKTPTIKVHMEQMDKDSINYDRFNNERKLLNDKVSEIYFNYSNERKRLIDIILKQQLKVDELIGISNHYLNQAENKYTEN